MRQGREKDAFQSRRERGSRSPNSPPEGPLAPVPPGNEFSRATQRAREHSRRQGWSRRPGSSNGRALAVARQWRFWDLEVFEDLGSQGPPKAECVLRGAGSCSDRAAWPPACIPNMGAAL